MKYLSFIFVLVFTACLPNRQAVKESSLTMHHVSESAFNEVFRQGEWALTGIYNVYSNDSIAEQRFEGGGDVWVSWEEKGLRFFYCYENYKGKERRGSYIGSYRYNEETNELEFLEPGLPSVAPSHLNKLKVLSISDDEIRCAGEVYMKKWAPTAVSGYYVFRKFEKGTR